MRPDLPSLVARALLAAALVAVIAAAGPGEHPLAFGAAWADDDDDRDDDDDDDDADDDDDDDDDDRDTGADDDGPRDRDDDDDDGDDRRGTARGGGDDPVSRFLRSLTGQQAPSGPTRPVNPAPPAAPAATPPPVARPERLDSAPAEIVARDLAAADLQALLDQGFTLIEQREIPALGLRLQRLRIAPGLGLARARATVRALPSGTDADFNHYYRPEAGRCEGLSCAAQARIDWPADRSACAPPAPIGMIDTGLNPDHEALSAAELTVLRRAPGDLPAAGPVHGTAVAALLVGGPAARAPGLLPEARLVAVDVFHRAGRDTRADVLSLVDGLGQLAEAGARVINLSLAGPANSVLEEAVDRLAEEQDVVMAAAAGNGGPRAGPAYPAAYDAVIAVTAVDATGQVYRRAPQGEFVELAAPGVEVWTAASVSGAKPKTGTSFAVPFATAAAALLRGQAPEVTAADVRASLARAAADLGEPGRDPVFGHGLVSAAGICAGGPGDAEIMPAAGAR